MTKLPKRRSPRVFDQIIRLFPGNPGWARTAEMIERFALTGLSSLCSHLELKGGPPDMQRCEGCADTRRTRASCMGDGPDRSYPIYIGLDVRRTACGGGCRGRPRRRNFAIRASLRTALTCLQKMVGRLTRAGRRFRLAQAGPCGYGLHRLLTGLGHDCVVIAPSSIPIKAGDRVKTDRRDALMLAKLHRAGELTAVWSTIRT